MDTFPYHAMTRPYAGDSPRWRTTDGGVASLTLGSGILRTRAELGQAIWAVDLQFQGLTQADASALWSFYVANRAATFYWSDPKTSPFASSAFATYECRFDPATPPDIAPSSQLLDRYDASMTLLPVVPTVAEEMLVAHWKMNDNAATTDVVDDTGNGHTLTASRNTDQITTTGKVGGGLAFNGSSDYVIRSSAAGFDSETGSILAWIKPADTSHNGTVFASADEATTNRFLRMFQNGTSLNYMAVNFDTADNLSTAAGVLTQAVWQHVALTCDGGTVRAYKNGVEYPFATAHSGANSGRWLADIANRDNVTIGVRKTYALADYFSGQIDDVRIYKRPLSTQEIRAIYNSGSGTEGVIVP